MRTERDLRMRLVADMAAKFGDLSTARPSPRTVRHFIANWFYRNGATNGGRVVGIKRFRVTRRRSGRIEIRLHGARDVVAANQWAGGNEGGDNGNV